MTGSDAVTALADLPGRPVVVAGLGSRESVLENCIGAPGASGWTNA